MEHKVTGFCPDSDGVFFNSDECGGISFSNTDELSVAGTLQARGRGFLELHLLSTVHEDTRN